MWKILTVALFATCVCTNLIEEEGDARLGNITVGNSDCAACDVPSPGISFLFKEVGAYAGTEKSNGQNFPHHF